MRCKKCNGQILQSNPKRCQYCGALINEEESQQTSEEIPPYETPQQVKQQANSTHTNSHSNTIRTTVLLALIGFSIFTVIFAFFFSSYSQTNLVTYHRQVQLPGTYYTDQFGGLHSIPFGSGSILDWTNKTSYPFVYLSSHFLFASLLSVFAVLLTVGLRSFSKAHKSAVPNMGVEDIAKHRKKNRAIITVIGGTALGIAALFLIASLLAPTVAFQGDGFCDVCKPNIDTDASSSTLRATYPTIAASSQTLSSANGVFSNEYCCFHGVTWATKEMLNLNLSTFSQLPLELMFSTILLIINCLMVSWLIVYELTGLWTKKQDARRGSV